LLAGPMGSRLELNVAAEYLMAGMTGAAGFRLFGRKHPPVRSCASPRAWLTP
jgi:hypothetical protein